MNYQKSEFVKSAVSPKDFIESSLPQIVFAGRSNVGKSSVINRLTGRKNFARVGAEPGKTIHINYFCIDERLYLVDLPGYGYAKVSKVERERWGRLIEKYFEVPGRIALGVLIVDIRHKPTQDDVTMASWFKESGCPLIVLANKLDKIKKSQINESTELIRQTLELEEHVEVLPFSAEKGEGRETLCALLGRRFDA